MKTKKILSMAICAVLAAALMTGCGSADNKASESAQTNSAEAVETEAQAESGAVVLNSENVLLTGRTYMMDDTLWCAFSGTGAAFDYTGSKLDITFCADSAFSSSENQARVAVYVDGERVIDEMLSMPEQTFTAYEGESKTVNVKIVKLSETAQSTLGIKPIEIADGESIVPCAAKERKIEFIGDSITCGYGVDDEVKENHFKTSTEDVTKAYAYKTAQKLDADYSIVSISGYGIISGYTSDPNKKSDKQLVPLYYDKLGFSYQRFANTTAPQDVEWDFSGFTPDAIVINLGTNDNSYCNTPEKRTEYTEAYKEFIGDIRAKNPDAHIFCTLGTMGTGMLNSMLEAAITYADENGDDKVHYIPLEAQDGSLGYAADWHPTEATHEKAADVVSEEIRNVMGW